MLITGGAGFIGSTLSERLLERGRRVVCLDNFCDYYDPQRKRRNVAALLARPGYTLVEGDIRDREFIRQLCIEHRFDTVIHLAAQPGVRLSLEQPQLYMDINVNGTLNLLEAARDSGVGKFVFGSSSSVYGDSGEIPFREEGPLNPISPYGVSKRTGELLCRNWNYLYGLNVAMLRFFTVYGPRQRPDMAIHKFVRRVMRGETIKLFGDGSSRRDYTFVTDIVEGILAVVESDFSLETYNLGDSSPVELGRLIATIEKAVGLPAVIERLPDQPGDPSVTYADISHASGNLGYCPKVGIQEGIERFVRWFREENL
ncbi:GDP-mannose 4,6-dehydratase [bacterium]|nr:GDP-mannose 4,6-dehydratase [bacterium]